VVDPLDVGAYSVGCGLVAGWTTSCKSLWLDWLTEKPVGAPLRDAVWVSRDHATQYWSRTDSVQPPKTRAGVFPALMHPMSGFLGSAMSSRGQRCVWATVSGMQGPWPRSRDLKTPILLCWFDLQTCRFRVERHFLKRYWIFEEFSTVRILREGYANTRECGASYRIADLQLLSAIFPNFLITGFVGRTLQAQVLAGLAGSKSLRSFRTKFIHHGLFLDMARY
jgi:hypothetical protein